MQASDKTWSKFRGFASALAAFALCACSGGSSDDETSQNSAVAGEAILAGTRLTEVQVADYLRDAGFPEDVVPKMVCTAKWESSFYTGAKHHNNDDSTDIGLFQINNNVWLKPCGVTERQLTDAVTNTMCALKVFHSKQGIRSWYAYTKHEKECANYHKIGSAHGPVDDPSDDPPSSGSSGSSTSGSSSGSPGNGSSSGSSSGDDGTYQDDKWGCWSPTLAETVSHAACVQSAYDGA